MTSGAGERLGVLFVCMGNICRSPVAEAIFADLVAAEGLGSRFDIDSAGTIDLHAGEAPDPRSAAEAARRGLALRHRARGLRPDDFQRFDWIIALDAHNLEALRARAPAKPRARLALLRSFDPLSPPGAEVPDPYYGGPEGFALVHDLCLRAGRGLLEQLRPTTTPANPRQ
ncbi:MAG: low molecular weight phosphotyrosine protein phosphatase [Deltaproteobacteria bacterium]|jgi:protein-tyrosine phosphatase|nr:low molecular weight phosphotyrosine protein phosphatase [Deltaproteobacteria bacterium]